MTSKSRIIVSMVMAVTMVSPALAGPPRYYPGPEIYHYDDARRDRRVYDDRFDRDYRGDRHDYRGRGRSHDRYGPDYRYDRGERYAYTDGRRDERAMSRWGVGDRFDPRSRYVVVTDYDRYHLSPPRRGHYYARTEAGELLLIAAATGLVVWALTN